MLKIVYTVLILIQAFIVCVYCENRNYSRENEIENSTVAAVKCGESVCEEKEICSEAKPGDFVCVCPFGKRGIACNLTDECVSDKFKLCRENKDSQCKYLNDFPYCDCGDEKVWNEELNKCLLTCGEDVCKENEVCLYEHSEKNTCGCPSGYRGNKCELQDECVTDKFKACRENNESKCKHTTDGVAYCDCVDEKVWDEQLNLCLGICLTKDCKNGGECKAVDGVKGNFKFCHCKSGTSGDFCDIVDDCTKTNFCGMKNNVACEYDGIKGGMCKCNEPDLVFDASTKECKNICELKCGNRPGVICRRSLKPGEGIVCACENKTQVYFSRYCEERCLAKCGYDINIRCHGDQKTYETTNCGCVKDTMIYDSDKICKERCNAKCGWDSKIKCDGDQKSFETTHCGCKNITMIYDADKKVCKDPCAINPCFNNGSCSVNEGRMKCTCIIPYIGELCEADPCTTNPCHNYGHCKVENGTAKCVCPFPYSGDFCETNPCMPNPCKNRGLCYNEHGVANCMCRPSFSGEYCETENKWMLVAVLAIVVLLSLIFLCSACIGFKINHNLKSINRSSTAWKT